MPSILPQLQLALLVADFDIMELFMSGEENSVAISWACEFLTLPGEESILGYVGSMDHFNFMSGYSEHGADSCGSCPGDPLFENTAQRTDEGDYVCNYASHGTSVKDTANWQVDDKSVGFEVFSSGTPFPEYSLTLDFEGKKQSETGTGYTVSVGTGLGNQEVLSVISVGASVDGMQTMKVATKKKGVYKKPKNMHIGFGYLMGALTPLNEKIYVKPDTNYPFDQKGPYTVEVDGQEVVIASATKLSSRVDYQTLQIAVPVEKYTGTISTIVGEGAYREKTFKISAVGFGKKEVEDALLMGQPAFGILRDGIDVEDIVITDVLPSEWTCDNSWFNDGIYCDCNCGIYDPDCGDPSVLHEQFSCNEPIDGGSSSDPTSAPGLSPSDPVPSPSDPTSAPGPSPSDPVPSPSDPTFAPGDSPTSAPGDSPTDAPAPSPDDGGRRKTRRTRSTRGERRGRRLFGDAQYCSYPAATCVSEQPASVTPTAEHTLDKFVETITVAEPLKNKWPEGTIFESATYYDDMDEEVRSDIVVGAVFDVSMQRPGRPIFDPGARHEKHRGEPTKTPDSLDVDVSVYIVPDRDNFATVDLCPKVSTSVTPSKMFTQNGWDKWEVTKGKEMTAKCTNVTTFNQSLCLDVPTYKNKFFGEYRKACTKEMPPTKSFEYNISKPINNQWISLESDAAGENKPEWLVEIDHTYVFSHDSMDDDVENSMAERGRRWERANCEGTSRSRV